jgi:hypothetical protein
MSWIEMFSKLSGAGIIMVVGILTAGAVTITWMLIRHRERMAKIEHGIDPNRPPDK